jgi:hypothetical protein
MAVTHWLEDDGQLIVVTAIGPGAPVDFVSAAREVAANPGVRPGATVLVDVTQADPAGFGVDDLWRMARGISPLLTRRITRIVIAASGDVSYGLSRAFEVSASAIGFNVRTCRSVEEARAWIAGR